MRNKLAFILANTIVSNGNLENLRQDILSDPRVI